MAPKERSTQQALGPTVLALQQPLPSPVDTPQDTDLVAAILARQAEWSC